MKAGVSSHKLRGFPMTELKSYSCPKCGSYLDVDRDREVLLNPIRTYSQLSDKSDEESKAAVKEAENDFKNEYPRFLLMDKQFRRT